MKVFILILLLSIGYTDLLQEDDRYLSPFRKEIKEKLLATYAPCLSREAIKTIEAFDYKIPELSIVPNVFLVLQTCRPKLDKIGVWMWKQGRDMKYQVRPWIIDTEMKFGRTILIDMEKSKK